MDVNLNNPKVDVIVLIAGEGKRLRPLTNDRPKGLLCCEDGSSIFSNVVRAFANQAWTPTIIPVIGHGRAKVHEEIARLDEINQFEYVYNPFYATAGPLVSLWLGLLQSKNDQVIVVNGDTLVTEALVQKVVPWIKGRNQSSRPSISLCVSQSQEFQPDDMKVALDADGAFVRTGKDIAPGTDVVKSAGVMSVRDCLGKRELKARLDQLVMDNKCLARKYYWHNVMDEVKDLFKVELIKVDSDSWYEIDTKIDHQSMIASGLEK